MAGSVAWNAEPVRDEILVAEQAGADELVGGGDRHLQRTFFTSSASDNDWKVPTTRPLGWAAVGVMPGNATSPVGRWPHDVAVVRLVDGGGEHWRGSLSDRAADTGSDSRMVRLQFAGDPAGCPHPGLDGAVDETGP